MQLRSIIIHSKCPVSSSMTSLSMKSFQRNMALIGFYNTFTNNPHHMNESAARDTAVITIALVFIWYTYIIICKYSATSRERRAFETQKCVFDLQKVCSWKFISYLRGQTRKHTFYLESLLHKDGVVWGRLDCMWADSLF